MEVIILWIKYVGEKSYNSMKVRNFKSKEHRDLNPELAKHLLEKYPNWFKQTKAPVKEVIEAIKEVPKVIKEALKDKSVKEDKKSKKEDIDIEVTRR